MKFNPFRPNAIAPPDIFSGRSEEISRVGQSLHQTSHRNPQHFLIEGERGIGKSSLFLLFCQMAKGELRLHGDRRFDFLVINIELRESDNFLDILNRIINSLDSEVKKIDKIKYLTDLTLDFASKFEAAGIKYKKQELDRGLLLDSVADALIKFANDERISPDGILILLDESDRPTVSAKLGEICKLLSERITRANGEKVLFGLTGLPGFVAKLRESHQSSSRMFTRWKLDTLSIEECSQVIERGIEQANKINNIKTSILNEAKKLIAEYSGGYPNFLQEIAFNSYEFDTDNVIDVKDVMNAIFNVNGALDQLSAKYFYDIYTDEINSDDYRKILKSIANFDKNSWASKKTIYIDTGVKEKIIANALRMFSRKEIIVSNPRIKGEYKLPSGSFGVWINLQDLAINYRSSQ